MVDILHCVHSLMLTPALKSIAPKIGKIFFQFLRQSASFNPEAVAKNRSCVFATPSRSPPFPQVMPSAQGERNFPPLKGEG